jgi:hypothetical protein
MHTEWTATSKAIVAEVRRREMDMQCDGGWPLAVDDGQRFSLFRSVMVKIGRNRPIYTPHRAE